MPALVPEVDLIRRTFEISRVCEESVAGKPRRVRICESDKILSSAREGFLGGDEGNVSLRKELLRDGELELYRIPRPTPARDILATYLVIGVFCSKSEPDTCIHDCNIYTRLETRIA